MDKIQPLVSIVMINYNGLSYIKRTIESIINLKYKNFEFIIVDNGSTDGSLEYIKSFGNIKLIQSPKLREKNFACNLGINNSIGEYILLCDNDLLITEDSLLENLLNSYNKNKKTGIIGLSYKDEGNNNIDGYGVYFGNFFIKKNQNKEYDEVKKLNLKKIGFPHGIGFFIKKEIWNKLGGYDENLKFGGDDNDIGIKSWIYGYKNYIYTNSIQLHIGLQERINTEKFVFKFRNQIYSELYVIVKNYRFINIIKTLFLYSLYLFLKSIKQSFEKISYKPFFAFFQGYYLFVKILPIAIKKRKEIQKIRNIQDDIFLKIKPPK